ncbi:MAG: tRNA (adenosine(37)-N6)-threonylcarbamoyltransferase complex ATPase subunit type 1 TsaE [Dehalococcoidia bacterium]
MPPVVLQLISKSPQETHRTGLEIGQLLNEGSLILLSGELGAGKTCLAQGIARGAGYNGYVTSPSFVLVKEYSGRLNIYHIDFYRLGDITEIAELGIDDYIYGDGVCIIEWAEKASGYMPEENLSIRLEHIPGEDESRFVQFAATGERYETLLEKLREKWNSV